MNDIFHDMQEQMTPSAEAADSLRERLEGTSPVRKRRPAGIYAAAAACAALAIAAYPVYRAAAPKAAAPALHSYVLAAGAGTIVQTASEESARVDTAGPDVAAGDLGAVSKDVDASVQLYPPAEASSAPVVDWDAEVEPGADPIPDEDVPYVPGGAMIADPSPVPAEAAVQADAVDAYQGLMEYFYANYGPDAYPDWYGGAYVQGSILIVCVADDNVPEEYYMDAGGDRMVSKEFYLQIQRWANSTAIGFSGVKYSYHYLRDLQEQVCALPELSGLNSWACGVDEMENLVGLEVPQADDALLAALAVLDPDDDAIRVTTGVYISTAEALVNTMDGDPAGYSK